MVKIEISNRAMFLILLLGALLVMTGFSYASWPSGKTVYHDAGDVKVTVGSSSDNLQDVVDDIYGDIPRKTECRGWLGSRTVNDAKIIFLTIDGENICADGDGCRIDISALDWTGGYLPLQAISSFLMYQDPSTNKWVAQAGTYTRGTNGDGTKVLIGGNTGSCAVWDDTITSVPTATGSLTENGVDAITLVDVSPAINCFFRICD